MKVPLEMPDEVWGRLATLADTREVKIADLIAEAVKTLIGDVVVSKRRRPRPDRVKATPEVLARVIAAHEAGMSWKTAAAQFGVSDSTVYQAIHRQKADAR